MDKKTKLQLEVQSMQNLWRGGTTLSRYGWENTVRQRMSRGCDLRFVEDMCIKPYVQDKVCLDIGTNGGGWLLRMLYAGASHCHGMDILPADHTGFWKNIPPEYEDKCSYHRVLDFSCKDIGDNTLEHVFSHDVFCHISFSGAKEYLTSLYSKCKSGANLFIMIADPEKYVDPSGRRKLMQTAGFSSWDAFVSDYDGVPNNGRWYLYGTDLFSSAAMDLGYKLIEKDVVKEKDRTSSVVHLVKE